MTHELKPRILVFGVGGAGGNAVDNMIEANLQGVEFIVANTDAQALFRSKTDQRIQLGPETTSGLGAGARPDVGAKAAEESIDEIKMYLEGAHMVFIAAGMGGGTGTGAAPIIARAAQEMGILTVAVVTKPFGFEGARRMSLADQGLIEIREHVDTMIVVPNQNLFRIANDRTTFAEAFRMADDVLYSGVRGITDLMVMPGLINLDFADVGSIMRGMGTAMMGMAKRKAKAARWKLPRAAIDNPLLDDVSLKGARGVLINITGGYDMTLFELDEAANEIRREIDPNANIILGSAFDSELEGKIRVSVVAAGIESGQSVEAAPEPVQQTVRQPIAEPIAEEVIQPETPADDDRPLVITGHAPSRCGPKRAIRGPISRASHCRLTIMKAPKAATKYPQMRCSVRARRPLPRTRHARIRARRAFPTCSAGAATRKAKMTMRRKRPSRLKSSRRRTIIRKRPRLTMPTSKSRHFFAALPITDFSAESAARQHRIVT